MTEPHRDAVDRFADIVMGGRRGPAALVAKREAADA